MTHDPVGMDNPRRGTVSRRDLIKGMAVGLAGAAGLAAVGGSAFAAAAPVLAGRPSGAPAVVKKGGTVTLGTAQDFPGLDPHLPTLLNERNLYTLLWNGLTKYSELMEVQPDLAERWEIPDTQTFVFYLRRGARFHHGREVTADDVKFSIERIQNPDTKSRYLASVDKIASIDVVDRYTVKLNLSKPNVIQHHELVDIKIVPKEAVGDLNSRPIGTGPYQFVEFVPGDHVTLKRFDGYWDGELPYPDQFMFRIIKDDTSLYNAFKAGQFDMIWQLRVEDNRDVESNPNLWVVNPKLSGNSMILQVDCREFPFNNKHARQALLYATDKETIFDLAYFQLGWPSPTNSSLAPNHWAFDSNLKPRPYDLDMARQLFKEAGVQEGYTITFNAISGLWRSWIVEGEILQQSLKQLGINLEIKPVDLSQWVANIRPPGKPYPNLINPNGNERAWDPAEQLKGYRCNELRASVFYCNEEVDTLMDQGLAELDPDKRKQIYGRVQEIVWEDVPWITTHHRPLNHAAWKHIQGVYVDGQGDLHLDALWTEK